MLAKIESRAIYGISAYRVDVEVDISKGVPMFSIVGLPDTACRESSKRVLAALKNSGYKLPSSRITVNLAPAYLKKEGSMYDLAIALGILAALDRFDKELLSDTVVCGELSLDGGLRSIKGALPIASELRTQKNKKLIAPHKNAFEISLVEGINAIYAHNLNDIVRFVLEKKIPEKTTVTRKPKKNQSAALLDYSDIKGNESAKRAVEIATSGGHNMLLIGPPGVGKTMIARRLPTIMNRLTKDQSIETSKIYSVCGLLNTSTDLINSPPFRILHHSISDAGMIGGGSSNNIRPGELSLAHNGVLFLDELPEFRRDALEALRQPLEEGIIRISRCNTHITYPAEIMLIAAMNPCPCGYLSHPTKTCSCTPPQVQKYLSKISGPLLDRIDMHIEVQPIKYEVMRSNSQRESSAEIKSRIDTAKKIQSDRYKNYRFKLNSKIPNRLVSNFCQLTDEASKILKDAMTELFLSARGYDKILRIARTIADMEEKSVIGTDEISEAISYRTLDTRVWL